METVLENSFVSIQDVQVDDILPISQNGPIRIDNVLRLQRSFQLIGVVQCSSILLYELSPFEQTATQCRFGVIDGAHRVVALKELRLRHPSRNFPSYLTARIYRNIEQDGIRYVSTQLNGVIYMAKRAEERK